MQKINWINGQAGGTPLSAENLNLMQDYMEGGIGDAITQLNGTYDFTADNGYIRFDNGLQIAWKSVTASAGGTSWANIWYSDHEMGNWKVAFNTLFTCVASAKGTQYWCGYADSNTTNAGKVRCFRPNNQVNSVQISIIGIGKWK